MAVQALRLRILPTAEAKVRERLGAGVYLRLARPQAVTLRLRLAPTTFTQAPATTLETSCGLLWLDDAQVLLSRLSECPAILAEPLTENEDNTWYWPLYNRHLAPELQALISPLRVVNAQPGLGLDCLLELHNDQEQYSVSRLRLAADTLLHLLEQGPWHPLTNRLDWPLRLALVLGHCPLSVEQLESLRLGDVLLIDQALFSAAGQGYLDVGACRLHLQQATADALRFTLTELEDLPMNASFDHLTLSDSDHLAQTELPSLPSSVDDLPTDSPSPERFDDLPLALTLRAGTLSLSLGQLRRLTVGSVLSFSGCIPGQAMLCQGERILALGDLVNIDGRLGLQITRLDARQ
ncbi:type III secretion system cytoplasmic ring protein SctQ [Pseudomonas sp. 22526]|uniref:type III secretion system cytoplasmic ring protein SctQ n=1 Tax=Pseudomonas sp. 22526 TaxID=3453937 RepID=UPI003F8616CF